MKKLTVITAVLAASLAVNAQNDVDALRYSQTTFGGTARFCAMGGAFGALGGDFSSLNFNHVGIVLAAKDDGEKALWRGIAMGFGYNRIATFSSRMYFEGTNDQSSLLDVFTSNAQNQTDINSLDPFGNQLAFYVGVIDTASAGNYYS